MHVPCHVVPRVLGNQKSEGSGNKCGALDGDLAMKAPAQVQLEARLSRLTHERSSCARLFQARLFAGNCLDRAPYRPWTHRHLLLMADVHSIRTACSSDKVVSTCISKFEVKGIPVLSIPQALTADNNISLTAGRATGKRLKCTELGPDPDHYDDA